MGGHGLEPIERGALEVREHKCHLRGLVREILPAEYNAGSLWAAEICVGQSPEFFQQCQLAESFV